MEVSALSLNSMHYINKPRFQPAPSLETLAQSSNLVQTTTMATTSLLVFISTLALIIFSTSYAARPQHKHQSRAPALANSRNYSIVCNQTKFLEMGVEMEKLGYCDKSFSFQVRAKDLVDRMTLFEKVQQVGNTASGVQRLGVPKYEWWSEALHGVSNVGPGVFFDDLVPGATSFPPVILTTASFNETLWKKIGQAVSTEARAMYNMGHAGLTYWSPNINVVRDPRWGRTTETPGEDPYVVGTYAKNYVRGLQDVEGTEDYKDLDSRPLKVSSCCKHYAAYDVDNWLAVDRFHFNAEVREQDMLETFLKPFEMCVKEGDVSSVMCSYNRINGIPACADVELLKNTIRGKWGLHGYIVSDCDSIEVMVDHHKWLGEAGEDASAKVMKAGLDLDCGAFYNNTLGNSVLQGKVSEKSLDEALINLYVVMMRVGFFDDQPWYKNLGQDDVCSAENIELAADAARQGIVLLKNTNQTLPLEPSKYKKLAIVGPHANATIDMVGNYAGIPCRYTTPLQAFLGLKNVEVEYAEGCDVLCKDDTQIFPAVQAAMNADATILFVGLNLSIEAEGLDRVDLLLPGYQTQLIQQVSQASKGPLILVVLSAGGVDISFTTGDSKIAGIIWAGYPGEEGGQAIADVIFGNCNPGGRLPVTWHQADYINQLPMTSMPLRPIDSLGYPGRTYKFFNGSTVFPFGYGLSYTNFTYSLANPPFQTTVKITLGQYQHCRKLQYSMSLSPVPNCPALKIDELKCYQTFDYNVKVQNTGSKDGDEVVIVYSSPPAGIVGTHFKQVIAFDRVFVPAGGSKIVKFQLDVCKSLGIVDETGYDVLPQGLHTITAGDNQTPYQVSIEFS